MASGYPGKTWSMRRCAVAVALLTLAGSGCGNSGSPPDQQARAALHTFLVACRLDRSVRASELLTEPVRKRFITAGSGLEGCQAVLGLRPGGALRGVRVTSLKLHPQSASATLRASSGETSRVELESSDDTWEIAGS